MIELMTGYLVRLIKFKIRVTPNEFIQKPHFRNFEISKTQVFRTFRTPWAKRPVGQRWPLLKGTSENYKEAIKKSLTKSDHSDDSYAFHIQIYKKI